MLFPKVHSTLTGRKGRLGYFNVKHKVVPKIFHLYLNSSLVTPRAKLFFFFNFISKYKCLIFFFLFRNLKVFGNVNV